MLPFLSKMFEKLMCVRLDSYLKSNNILCTNQFGFRKNSNTSDAIIEFLDYVYSSVLESSVLDWTLIHHIVSYLSNRKQYISVKNFSSSMSNITLGVPQGSVVGPVLFFCTSMTCIDPLTSCALFI